jgi:hypothetical protein
MKKLFFFAIAILIVYAISYAHDNAPEVVTNTFNQKYPNASHVKWDNEDGHEYEVSFIWNDIKCSADFSNSGEWLKTKSKIQFNQLPENVQQAFLISHKDNKIKSVNKYENSKGEIKFEIEFKNGKHDSEVKYSSDGKEINW